MNTLLGVMARSANGKPSMTKISQLDSMTDAYNQVYMLDNKLMQQWYPRSACSLPRTASRCLSSAFAQHFQRCW
ncbi:MAG: hypothetical protein IPK97_17870 [Ahniella sp.]|nr:hypothetical protein [Ahniella sp.]